MTQALEHVTLNAPDISCGHCVAAIQNRLGELDGVTSVTASAESKVVEVKFDTSKLTLDTIKEELADEGYPVS